MHIPIIKYNFMVKVITGCLPSTVTGDFRIRKEFVERDPIARHTAVGSLVYW